MRYAAGALVQLDEMSTSPQNRTKLRPLAMIGLGAAGGALVGRLLPILIANASGAARVTMGQDPFATLIRDHRELLDLLERMEHSVDASALRKATFAYLFKRKISKHAMAEENVVYPTLTDHAERAEATRKLYEEHARMKILLFELEQSISNHESWFKAVRGLSEEIEPHARQEEEVEFPALGARMDKAGKMKLARKIHGEQAVIV